MATTRKRSTKPAVEPTDELDDIEEVLEDEDVEVEEAPAPKKTTRTRRKANPEPEPEPEDDEDVEEEEPAPAAKPKAKKAAPAEKGTAWLVEHVNETLGTSLKTADLRVLLRKLAKAGKLDREVGTERSRYSFTGPKDAIVVAVVKAVKSGDLDKERKAKLDELKAKKAAKAAKVEEADDEVEDLDDDE